MAKIQIKRGKESNLPILSEGELAVTTDKTSLYIGAGGGKYWN